MTPAYAGARNDRMRRWAARRIALASAPGGLPPSLKRGFNPSQMRTWSTHPIVAVRKQRSVSRKDQLVSDSATFGRE